jgi:hypothetical protein
VYLDLLLATQRSARPGVDASFFAAALPVLERPADVAALAASLFDATWFGRPLSLEYPLDVRGVSWTPAVCLLLPLAPPAWRRGWPWIAFAAAAVLFAVVRPLHAFGVEYLGLSLSRHAPLAAAHVPVAVLAALGADRVLRGEARRAGRVAPVLVTVFAVVCAVLAGLQLDAAAAGVGLGLAVLTAVFVATRARALLVMLGLATVLVYGAPMRLARPLQDTRVESPFVESLRAATAGGARYVWVGAAWPGSLHPNQEVLFDLRSVHSNNSLSSRAYQDWMRRVWSVRGLMEGRLFARLPEGTRPDPQALSFAGIAAVVSGPGVIGASELPPLLQAQFARFEERGAGRVALARDRLRAQPVERVQALDDALTFTLGPAQRETLLFVSQQHHPDWTAYAGGRELETVVVNDFYQGVRVPPGVGRVELRFRSWVHWSWLPQVVFAALGLFALSARRRRAAGSAPFAPAPQASP